MVSVVLATRNRPQDVRDTLRLVRAQSHARWEIIVVDDCSDCEVKAVVRQEWPDARVCRNDRNIGQAASRSAGMKVASGEFILGLDDDSAPVAADAVALAVERMRTEPKIGIITFTVHNGPTAPRSAPVAVRERYVASFLAGGCLIRRSVVEQVGAYEPLFHHEGEEEEMAMRVIDAGWRILYLPSVLVHHRMAVIGRHSARTWAFGARNKTWTVLMRMPARHLTLELVWKIAVNSLEMFRRLALGWGLWAVASCMAGVPAVLGRRKAITQEGYRRYEALRFREIVTAADADAPSPVTFAERWRWLRGVWWNRRRQEAFWSRAEGGVGKAQTVTFDAPITERRIPAGGTRK